MKKFLYFFKAIIILFIKFYKVSISPFLGKNCRFYPSCSQYTITSIEKYGLFKGLLKSVFRLIRCNPFNSGGVDLP
ncbi:MAG: membrane protein insertion efficiency factor YidD [Endomicrobia bacterium]|nr:membrane protein insertion efficiency factor YidD [Endomicrobiia bacterium]